MRDNPSIGKRRPDRPHADLRRKLHALTLCDNAADFRALLPPKGSLLALDLSKRRIGVAGSDQERRLSTPIATLDRSGATGDVVRLAKLVRERQAVGLVVGLPINMDGSEGPMAKAMRAEAARLVAALGLPALLQDERLSTFAVEDAIAEGRLPRPRKGQPVDHYAAMVILEDALRALHQ
jgi:putative Holliday junction resolvase